MQLFTVNYLTQLEKVFTAIAGTPHYVTVTDRGTFHIFDKTLEDRVSQTTRALQIRALASAIATSPDENTIHFYKCRWAPEHVEAVLDLVKMEATFA